MRVAEIKRKTAETDIALSLNLDGKGESNIDTGCGFLDHMLTLFAKHAHYDLNVKCVGDTYVDYHHTVEDIGISLGKAFSDCLADKKGIRRYGDKTIDVPIKGYANFNSDQKNFPYGVGIAAFKRKKLIGLYVDRIHTPKDTVLEETNVNILRACLTSLVACDAAE